MLDLLFSWQGVLAIAAIFIISLVYYFLFNSPPKRETPKFNPTVINKPKTPASSAKKLMPKKSGPPLKILFGSQTGTAEEFSKTLCEEALSQEFNAEVMDLEEYQTDNLADEKFVIFVVATYGEGEPTDNAKEFHEWLMSEDREAGSLSNVKYTVFGLGNKTYEHFNQMGTDFDRRMEELGATRIYEKGDGDDDASLEEDFENWKSKLWISACGAFGMAVSDGSGGLKKPNYEIKWREDLKGNTASHCNAVTWKKGGHGGSKRDKSKIDQKNPYWAKVLVNKELHTEKSDRSCRHLEIDITDVRALNYEPGDHLGVFVKNRSNVVEDIIARLGVDAQAVLELIPVNEKTPHIGPCTVQRVFEYFVDLTTPPRKSVFQALAQYCTDPAEKEKMTLLGLNTEEGTKEYNNYIKSPLRSIGEVLKDFPSCKPPLEHLVELLPFLAPRFYSISSSLLHCPGRVHITAIVVEYVTPAGRKHEGVATHYLRSLIPKDDQYPEIPIFIRKSQFRLPAPSKSIVMIGPGTGLAPFRGFIQHRAHQKDCGKTFFFFGCRRKDTDYIYKEELEAAATGGTITKLVLAFSRESNEKVYVQHKILETKAELWPIIKEGGFVYVCGDARNMAKDVHKALQQVAVEVGGLSEKDALSFVTQLETSGRYQKDVWY